MSNVWPTGRAARAWKHGDSANRQCSPEYIAWCSMKARCDNPNNTDFKNWGGRGIAYCARWKEFPNFLADMGRKPTSRHTLGRRNNDGNYEPGNCQWELRTIQGQNRRGVRLTMDKAKEIRSLYHQGVGGYVIADRFGVNYRTIYDILWNKTWKEESSHLADA